MMNQSGIYEIVNTVNGKRYIGSANKLKLRQWQHVNSLKRNKHHSIKLQRAWNKYGEAAFKFLPILTCQPSMLLFYEQQLLDKVRPEYNIAPTAGSSRGIKRGPLSPEHKAKISEGGKGLKRSEETRKRMSEAQKGNKKSQGRKPSAEALAAQSVRSKGNKYGLGVKRPRSPEHTAKIVASRAANKAARQQEGVTC